MLKRIGINSEEITKTISYKVQFIDSTKHFASSSNLVDNLIDMTITNVKLVELNRKIVSPVLNTQTLQMI